MQICIERTGENAILMHFQTIIPDKRSFGVPENILTTNHSDFPAVWDYGKLYDKFLVSRVKVIDTVGFLSFFKKFYSNTY